MGTLTWRGVDLLSQQTSSTREGIRIQIVRGFLLPPDVRGEDWVVAARPGRVVGNRVADVLTIGLAGYVSARTPEQWRIFTDQLVATFAEAGNDPGELVAGDGYLGLAPGDTATITARVKNAIEGEIMAKLYQRWSIQLESIDPDWTLDSDGS